MKYGIWFPQDKRWTKATFYPKDGFNTFQEAVDFRKKAIGFGSNFVVRIVNVDGSPGSFVNENGTIQDDAPTYATTIPSIVYGAHCKKCGEYNQYVPQSDTFVCFGCRQ